MKVMCTLLWLICHINGNIACLCLCSACAQRDVLQSKVAGLFLYADKILTVTQAVTLLVFILGPKADGEMTFK